MTGRSKGRRDKKNQPAFMFDFEPPVTHQSEREQYTEQVRRDVHVLREDEEFWQPNKEFYERRIASMREAIKEIDDGKM